MSDAFYKSSFFLIYLTLLYDDDQLQVGALFRCSRLISNAFV